MDKPVYIPSPWGTRYHACTVFELLGAGSAGVGKSVVLLWDPLSNILTSQKQCERGDVEWGESMGWALHLRRREGTLALTIDRAKKWYPKVVPGAKWVASENWMLFPSGYKLQFGHCNNVDDYMNYMSNEYDHIALDELIEFEKIQYDNISGRCRSSDPALRAMRRVRAMSNPYQDTKKINVDDPMWVRDYFIEHAPQGNVVLEREFHLDDGTTEARGRMYMPGRLSDNPDRDFARDFEVTLRSKGSNIRKPLLEGDWYFTKDAFFDDWDNRLHVRTPFQIPNDWFRFRMLDWGFKTYGAILWFAQDNDGNLWCEREFSYRNMMPDAISKAMREIEKEIGLPWRGGKSQITGPADHDLWEERGSLNAERKIVTFMRNGVKWVRANKKDPVANAQMFATRLRDHNGGTTLPGIVFFNTCTQCMKTIPGLKTDRDNPEKPRKSNKDHWYKAASYGCAYVDRTKRSSNKDPDDDPDDFNPPPAAGGTSSGYGVRY